MQVNDPQMLFGGRIEDGESLHQMWRVMCVIHQRSNLLVYVDADD